MIFIEFHNREGDLVASVETKEPVLPRTGEVVRVAEIDYKIEFVRWTLEEDRTLVEVMVERLEHQGSLWPDGASATVHKLFKTKEE
jgi:hypothetical protein